MSLVQRGAKIASHLPAAAQYAQGVNQSINPAFTGTASVAWKTVTKFNAIITGSIIADPLADGAISAIQNYGSTYVITPVSDSIRSCLGYAPRETEEQILNKLIQKAIREIVPKERFAELLSQASSSAAEAASSSLSLVASYSPSYWSSSSSGSSSIESDHPAEPAVIPANVDAEPAKPNSEQKPEAAAFEQSQTDKPIEHSDVIENCVSSQEAIEGPSQGADEPALAEDNTWWGWSKSWGETLATQAMNFGSQALYSTADAAKAAALELAYQSMVKATASMVTPIAMQHLNTTTAALGDTCVRWGTKQFIARPLAQQVFVGAAEYLFAGYVTPIDFSTKVALSAVPMACAAVPAVYSVGKTWWTRRQEQDQRAQLEVAISKLCINSLNQIAAEQHLEPETLAQISQAIGSNLAAYLMQNKSALFYTKLLASFTAAST